MKCDKYMGMDLHQVLRGALTQAFNFRLAQG